MIKHVLLSIAFAVSGLLSVVLSLVPDINTPLWLLVRGALLVLFIASSAMFLRPLVGQKWVPESK